uniref:Uncharacterized protein n=1 Tax=Zea mays TaxID=4577 RepID=C0PLR1_MAIZE|nr:unknown [Zea mays]
MFLTSIQTWGLKNLARCIQTGPEYPLNM